MIWFTSDLHFSHESIIEYCKRPFASVDEMNIALLKNWNALVRPNDTIYVLGDLTLTNYKSFEPIGRQLNGHKILIQGNHDKFSRSQYLSLGFKAIFEEAILKIAGKRVRLSHFPHRPSWWAQQFTKAADLRYMDRRPPRDGLPLLHGHTHSPWKKKWGAIHVGVDAWKYGPVSAAQIESLLYDSREFVQS